MWERLRRRFAGGARRDRFENELAGELEFHLQMRAEALQRSGLSREEALRRARVELGNPEKIKEDVRDLRFGAWLDPLLQDLRYGLRMLRKHPGVTTIGVASLAVGIGVCTYFFSQFNAMVLRPLPGSRAPRALAASSEAFSYPVFERFRELDAIADAAAAYIGPTPFHVVFDESDPASEGARIFGHLVSPEYFSVLGVTPAAGRFFDPEAERVGSEAVAVVSDSFWRRRLNADPRAVGRTLRINGRRVTIVGIAPEGFRGVFPVNPADVFVPVTAGPSVAPELRGDVLRDPEAHRFHVVLRLARGVSMSAAEAALDTVARTPGRPAPRPAAPRCWRAWRGVTSASAISRRSAYRSSRGANSRSATTNGGALTEPTQRRRRPPSSTGPRRDACSAATLPSAGRCGPPGGATWSWESCRIPGRRF